MPPRAKKAFAPRASVHEVEEGVSLAPKFDAEGLMPVAVSDHETGTLLMVGYMNAEALQKTLKTGIAHYWSRSRNALWRKGETSGMVHEVVEARIDDDQDALWLRVHVQGRGASCHVGYESCFYRSVPLKALGARLVFMESEKRFDPEEVYGDAENPTRL